MKRLKLEKLEPGDIVLTASATKAGKLVRFSSGGTVSHAMICVQHGSVIDSTDSGVQAWNLQRELFEEDDTVFAFRLRGNPPQETMARIIDFARSQIGARYSKAEAARTVLGGKKPRNNRQFCSRLVAQAYESVGIQLVADHDYCSPEDLRVSPLLIELSDITDQVSAEEISLWRSRADPGAKMREAQNVVLSVARKRDPNIENFQDLDHFVLDQPRWDAEIAQAFKDSGYLELWKYERTANPWRYDINLMESIREPNMLMQLRQANIETIREAYSGGKRYAVNLIHYQTMQKAHRRETAGLLVELYDTLLRNDHLWRETARNWLLCHHPEDVTKYMERVTPHSELWFSIVDCVEPNLGMIMIARLSIEASQSADVCSSCGDPARDYRIANSPDAMPGVPSLRLCDDCVSIRRGFGECLESLD